MLKKAVNELLKDTDKDKLMLVVKVLKALVKRRYAVVIILSNTKTILHFHIIYPAPDQILPAKLSIEQTCFAFEYPKFTLSDSMREGNTLRSSIAN